MKWLGIGAGAAAAGGFVSGCRDDETTAARDTGIGGGPRADGDSGTGPGRPDAGPSGADSTGAETGPDGTDTGADDTSDGDDADAETCEATGDDIEGPFFEEGAPERRQIAPDDEPGQRIVIEGTVYEPDCRTPIPGALLDVWHANEEGDYYDASEDYRLRGQLKTADDGSYAIYTIKPGRYDAAGGLRPAHVHFTISSPQFGPLTTQMYFAGDSRLGESDSCGACASDDPTLIVDFQSEQRNGREVLVGTFDIVLSER